MKLALFPAMPNTRRVRELRDFSWEVDVSGKTIQLAFRGHPPMAEVRLAKEPEQAQWQGDVLVMSDRGEFAIAVNRGLVFSLECERLVLAEKGLDREERTLKGRSDAGHFLLYFEWGDEIRYRKVKDGQLAITSPGADYPLMLFMAAAPSPALAETEMDRLKSISMGDVVAMTQSFATAQPTLELSPKIDALWEHAHQLHRINTYEPEPPFIYEWECPTRSDAYASRVTGHLDSVHTVWDWILVDPTRARQEFENYLKSYDPVTSALALDVAPIAEDPWPRGQRKDSDGRCMVSSHPPVWPEVAWRLYQATNDKSWLTVTYEIAKLNIGWWERERDRDQDGFFEWADTRFPQPWESGCDGSPRFDDITCDGFACLDLNAQLVMFYRNLVRFAVELGEQSAAKEYLKRQDHLARLVNERLWDPASGWYYDFGEDGLVRVKTTAALWALNAGIASPEQTDLMLEHLSNPEEFATWFPLPSVAVNEPTFASAGWRGPAWPSQSLWLAMGLRSMGRVEAAGRLIRRTLDCMAEVLAREGAVFECYNPFGPGQEGVRLFSFRATGDPVRRNYLGHAPVRAMVLYGLLGIEPTREGLSVAPAAESLEKHTRVEFLLGKQSFAFEAEQRKEGLHTKIKRGKKTLAEGFGKLLVPRVDLE